jgi:hypothetical protein
MNTSTTNHDQKQTSSTTTFTPIETTISKRRNILCESCNQVKNEDDYIVTLCPKMDETCGSLFADGVIGGGTSVEKQQQDQEQEEEHDHHLPPIYKCVEYCTDCFKTNNQVGCSNCGDESVCPFCIITRHKKRKDYDPATLSNKNNSMNHDIVNESTKLCQICDEQLLTTPGCSLKELREVKLLPQARQKKMEDNLNNDLRLVKAALKRIETDKLQWILKNWLRANDHGSGRAAATTTNSATSSSCKSSSNDTVRYPNFATSAQKEGQPPLSLVQQLPPYFQQGQEHFYLQHDAGRQNHNQLLWTRMGRAQQTLPQLPPLPPQLPPQESYLVQQKILHQQQENLLQNLQLNQQQQNIQKQNIQKQMYLIQQEEVLRIQQQEQDLRILQRQEDLRTQQQEREKQQLHQEQNLEQNLEQHLQQIQPSSFDRQEEQEFFERKKRRRSSTTSRKSFSIPFSKDCTITLDLDNFQWL